MDLEALKNVVRTGNLASLDTPEATELIESLTLEQANELNNDKSVFSGAASPIQRLLGELKADYVDRDELITIALASFLVQVPMLALGPPGTAKSAVFRGLAERIGLRPEEKSLAEVNKHILDLLKTEKPSSLLKTEKAAAEPQSVPQRRYFEYLVTRFTTADEILGPPHLELMISHALFFRQTAGLLPEADVVFLDEVFKANSAILNALLSIMNERLFYNAGRSAKIPVSMVFGASNEPPPDQELSALYDRFPIRVMCDYVDDPKLAGLLNAAAQGEKEKVFSNTKRDEQQKKKVPIASVNHFRLMHRLLFAHQDARPAAESKRFKDAFIDTFRVFRRDFRISDRSLHRFYRLAHGLAIVRGKDYPDTQEFSVFKYCFQDMDAAPALADAVDYRIAPR
jgi:MoxR-like ATPase